MLGDIRVTSTTGILPFEISILRAVIFAVFLATVFTAVLLASSSDEIIVRLLLIRGFQDDSNTSWDVS